MMKQYILVDNGQFVRYVDIYSEYPNISFPQNITEDVLPDGVKIAYLDNRPNTPFAKVALMDPVFENEVWTSKWSIEPLSAQEILRLKEDKLSEIRVERDMKMRVFDWRYLRYDRETRMNLMPTDDISKLDEYMQALADITKQEDPFNIQWPIEP